MIGGSDIGAILGLSPWETPLMVWRRLRGLDPGRPETWTMVQGRAMEAPIAEAWARREGWTLEPGPQLVHPEHEFLRATLDYIARRAKEHVVVEVKWHIAPWDEVPPAYYCQVQWYLHFVGLPRAYIVHAGPTQEPEGLPIDADPDVQESLIEAAVDFWRRVQAGEPPEPTGPDERASLALSRIRDRGAVLRPDEHLDHQVQEMLRAEQEMKRLEARVKEARAALLEAMAAVGATRVQSASGWSATLIERRGNIRYADAMQALGISAEALEPYRGEPIRYVRISTNGGNGHE